MGNLPRNALGWIPLRQLDLSLARTVPLFSGVRLQVRADLFNALNTANFANPSGNLGSVSAGAFTPSSTFGVSSSMLDNALGGRNGVYRLYATGGPRSVQLSGRLTF